MRDTEALRVTEFPGKKVGESQARHSGSRILLWLLSRCVALACMV